MTLTALLSSSLETARRAAFTSTDTEEAGRRSYRSSSTVALPSPGPALITPAWRAHIPWSSNEFNLLDKGTHEYRERHGDVRHVCSCTGTEGCPPDRCMTTHLFPLGFAAYEAFEDSGVNEKAGLI
jgi:hypothetical protein